MSTPKTNENARRLVSSWIKDLYSSKTTPYGLSADIFACALGSYGATDLGWTEIRDKAIEFRNYVSAQVADCTIRQVFRRPLGRRTTAASVSIFRLAAKPLRLSETFFGAYDYTFTFWPDKLWFLSTVDPANTTDHLHRRLVARAAGNIRSLAQAQDDLSTLWPTLMELGNRRRSQGCPADVAHFISPLEEGLVFGEFQKNDFERVEEAAPRLTMFHNGAVAEQKLFDYYSVGQKRAMVLFKTYIGQNQLKDTPQNQTRQIYSTASNRYQK